MTINIDAFRWGDIERTIAFADDAGDPLDFTAHTVEAKDIGDGLQGRVNVSFEDAAGGVVRVFIEGTDGIRLGTHEFRLQILDPNGASVGGLSDGFPPVRVAIL